MMSSKEVAKRKSGSAVDKIGDIFDPKNLTVETIRDYFCKEASVQELTLGLSIAKSNNLNPMKKEIYFVKYGAYPMSVLTGYEVYLKRADRSGKYAGMKAWTEGSIDDGDFKGCVEIYRIGWEKPLYHEADYDEYVQKKNGEPTKFWKDKPKTMIKKVAISQGFRLAFPDEFDGLPKIREEFSEAYEESGPAQSYAMPKEADKTRPGEAQAAEDAEMVADGENVEQGGPVAINGVIVGAVKGLNVKIGKTKSGPNAGKEWKMSIYSVYLSKTASTVTVKVFSDPIEYSSDSVVRFENCVEEEYEGVISYKASKAVVEL